MDRLNASVLMAGSMRNTDDSELEDSTLLINFINLIYQVIQDDQLKL